MMSIPRDIRMVASVTAGLLSVALAPTANAGAQGTITPYIAVDQTVLANLKGGSEDVLTYTSVAAGVATTIETRSLSATADLRYEHQFSWNSTQPDQDIISGIATVALRTPVRGLTLEAGALATRVRSDGLNGANNNLISAGSTANIYSGYAGPTFTGGTGDLSINAAYRVGYNRVDDDFGLAGGGGLPSFDESWNHYATASVGMQPGSLPFGWSVGAGYEREDQSQLDQRYDGRWVRGDVTVPITTDLALVGGVGYEDIEISNRDALRDANGFPVISTSGRFVTDPASPRRLAYDDAGLIWDAGVLWRPSRRTTLELRAGRRYGSMSYTGSFSWTPNKDASLSIALFDSVDSFGRALSGSLANLSTDFTVSRNPFSGDLTGCVFDTGGSSGLCFNDALSSVSTASFRSRGILAQLSARNGGWSFGAGAGYTRRRFLADQPGVLFVANGIESENVFGSLSLGRELDSQSIFQLSVYGNYFDNGFAGGRSVINTGAILGYDRTILERLSATASIGVDMVDPSDGESIVTGIGQLGMRYSF